MNNLKIFATTRNSMIGDIIASLPFTTYIAKRFPDSIQTAYIDKKCKNIIPFLINHDYIKEIRISEKIDEISENDRNYVKYGGYDLAFYPFPPTTTPDWFNKHHICRELFDMNTTLDGRKPQIGQWDFLTSEEKMPRLNQWFDVPRHEKTVAIWPKSGYANNDESINKRSPSNQFWHSLYVDLTNMGYKIAQLGFSDIISSVLDVIDLRNLSLFQSIQYSLGCDCVLSTDSGVGWIIGALGHPQVCLYTNYKEGHHSHFNSYLPVNNQNNLIGIYGQQGNINNIEKETVLQGIRDLTSK